MFRKTRGRHNGRRRRRRQRSARMSYGGRKYIYRKLYIYIWLLQCRREEGFARWGGGAEGRVWQTGVLYGRETRRVVHH